MKFLLVKLLILKYLFVKIYILHVNYNLFTCQLSESNMDDKALHQSISQINMDQELSLGSTWVTFEANSGQINIFLVLTEFNLYLFNKDDKNDKMNIFGVYSLFDVKTIEIPNMSNFSISFADKYLKFSGEDIAFFPDLIHKQLLLLLLPIEMPTIKGKVSKPGANMKHNVKYMSVLLRLCGKLKLINRYPPQQFIDDLQAYLKTEPSEFVVNQFKDIDNYIDSILEAVEIEPMIISLNFTGKQVLNHWNNLSVFIRNNTTIQKIVISEEINRGFIEFCASLSKNSNSKLKRIEFKNVSFSPEHIEALDKATQKHPFLYLMFDSCNFTDSAQKLTNLIVNNTESSSNLISLHMSSINLSKIDIGSSIRNLQYVSLRGCCIEISSLFENFKNTKIIFADFSNNRCSVPLSDSMSFPSTLVHLCLNDIAWSGSSLAMIFNSAGNCKLHMSLSVANAQMLEDDWISFFNLIELTPSSNFHSICWHRNPIHHKLCRFFAKLKNLKFLSLSGCKIPSDGCVQKLISSSKSLSFIDIHGTNDSKLGNEIISILRSFKNSKVESIDISNNNIPSLAVPMIADLIMSPTKQFIICNLENLDLTNYSSILNNQELKSKTLTTTFNDYAYGSFVQSSTQLFVIEDSEFIVQYCKNDTSLPIPDEPEYQIAKGAFLFGRDFWDINKIEHLKKKFSNSERQVISWDLNLSELRMVDTNSFIQELENNFDLETLGKKLRNCW